MQPNQSSRRTFRRRGFSMVEVVVTMAIIAMLIAAGASMMGDSGAKARRTTSDLLSGMIEQGRSTAITSHSQILLVVAEPRDLMAEDNNARVGLIKLSEFDSRSGRAKGVLLRRWEVLPTGVALIGGDAGGLRNVMDGQRMEVNFRSGGKESTVNVRGLVFSPRGGRDWPTGSTPVALRVAEGGYRGELKEASANKRDGTIPEDLIKVGRVIARAQRFDP